MHPDVVRMARDGTDRKVVAIEPVARLAEPPAPARVKAMALLAPHRPASRLLGGISSNFRTNPYTGGHLEVDSVDGPWIRTSDRRTYIDLFMAHGSAVLGHADQRVFAAMRDVLEAGVVVGYETGLGDQVADRLGELLPAAEACRFVASGSEAVLTAIRLARAWTGRDVIIKIDGQFNGGNDYVLFNSMAALSDPDNPGGRVSAHRPFSRGIPRSVEAALVLVPWNDLPALEAAYTAAGDGVAAVVMVPIDYNNGCFVPDPGYLAAVKAMTTERGSLLIFDEVLSGFKTGTDCAQGLFGVAPDLTTLSKALSNGVPLSVVAGRADILSQVNRPVPTGVVQGGTFAGNTLGLAAAAATLDILAAPDFYPTLRARTDRFLTDLQAMFDRSPVPARVQWLGCGFGIYIGTREPVHGIAEARRLDPALARTYFSRCIERGVYFHTDFTVSAAHEPAVLDQALERMADAAAQPI
jgi:glutamate-1-semialdehyde 2,1-aminomutase